MDDQKSDEIKPQPQPAEETRKVLTSPIILGQLVLASPVTQTTIGVNGAASALTANPVGYLQFMIGNTQYVIPYYNVA